MWLVTVLRAANARNDGYGKVVKHGINFEFDVSSIEIYIEETLVKNANIVDTINEILF